MRMSKFGLTFLGVVLACGPVFSQSSEDVQSSETVQQLDPAPEPNVDVDVDVEQKDDAPVALNGKILSRLEKLEQELATLNAYIDEEILISMRDAAIELQKSHSGRVQLNSDFNTLKTTVDRIQNELFPALREEIIAIDTGKTGKVDVTQTPEWAALLARVTALENKSTVVQLGPVISDPVDPGPIKPDGPKPQSESPFRFVLANGDYPKVFTKVDVQETYGDQIPGYKDCPTIGAWVQASKIKRDYNSFFVSSRRGVRICELRSTGWFVLNAQISTQSHVVLEVE